MPSKKKPKKVIDPEQAALEEERKRLLTQAQYFNDEIKRENLAKERFSSSLVEVKIFWDIEKDQLEQKKGLNQEKTDEINSMQVSHQSQIHSVRDQIKHQLFQQKNELTQAKNETQVKILKLNDDQTNDNKDKIEYSENFEERLKEIEISHHNFMVQLKRDYDLRIDKLHRDFKRKYREISVHSERNLKGLREGREGEAKVSFQHLEDDKYIRIEDTRKVFEERLNKLQEKYNEKLHGQLDTIQNLKSELSHKKQELQQSGRTLSELEEENRNIVEPFSRAKEDLDKLEQDAKDFRTERKRLETRKNELKQDEDRLKEMQWKHEVLYQKYLLLGEERAEKRKKFERALLQTQQQNSLNKMLLNEKITSLCKVGQARISALAETLGIDPVVIQNVNHSHRNTNKCIENIGKSKCSSSSEMKETSTVGDLDMLQSQIHKLQDELLSRHQEYCDLLVETKVS